MIRYVLVREELDDVRQVATSTPLADLPVLFPGLVVQITVQPDGSIDAELVRPEVEMLRRWKDEATEVIEQWETLVELVPEPTLGQTKWDSVRGEIERLRIENGAVGLAPQSSAGVDPGSVVYLRPGSYLVTVADGSLGIVPAEHEQGRVAASDNGLLHIQPQGADHEDGHEHKWRFNGGSPMCGECGEYRAPYVQRVYPAVTDPEPEPLIRTCDECEMTGTNCTAHGGRPGILWRPDAPVQGDDRG